MDLLVEKFHLLKGTRVDDDIAGTFTANAFIVVCIWEQYCPSITFEQFQSNNICPPCETCDN